MASAGNQLYTTSNKSLKIWNLENMTCVSDIAAHTSFIKCMTIWDEKKLLLTASDKVIMLWDMISLTNVGMLKGHKDEIRTLKISPDGNLLFSAGKGT
jgi:WD40 repeat protein